MLRTVSIVCLCLALSVAFAAQNASREVQTYTSPDKAVVAKINFRKALDATPESMIEISSASGKLLMRKAYTSADGEHGYGVTEAAWTPDSRFFVYSLESSGGHQAWHSPIDFFNRSTSKVENLDNKLNDAVMNPHFILIAPDKVTVDLYFGKKTRTVSLSALAFNKEKRPIR